MPGIISYGAYVPFNRLQRATIGAALEASGGNGERAVASYDEDTVTLAIEASKAALAGDAALRDRITSLYFATTNPPYQEKLNAATAHAALSLPDAVRSQDTAGSVGAGVSALLSAADHAAAGGTALAALADIRIGAPEGVAEKTAGDAAAAFILGDEPGIAEIEAAYCETLEHMALWRLPGEMFNKTWEERFSLTQVYNPLFEHGAKALLEKSGVSGSDLAAVVIDTPNARAAGAALKGLGVDAARVVPDLVDVVGHSGAAHAGLLIAKALDGAKPGDRIAVLSVSDGVHAVLLRATDAIANYTPAATVDALVESKRNDLGYNRFLKWRGIMQTERPRQPDPDRPAGPPAFRRRHWKFAFTGSECTACGARHLPPQRVCVSCGAVDQMKDIPFANARGKIATYTLDRLAFTLQPPMVMAMVDFEGGGRVELEVTDCEPEQVEIGMELEMTFRRLFTADGVHNYFWKARPIR